MVTAPGSGSPPQARPPPPLPNDPAISTVLSNYLNQFSLWCRQGFAAKLNAKTALNNVMFQGYDAPTGANPAPNVYALEVSNDGTAAIAQVSLASGNLGTPTPIGTGEFLPLEGGSLSGSLSAEGTISIVADADTGGNAYVGFFDESGVRRGYSGYVGGIVLSNDTSGGSVSVLDNGSTVLTGAIETSGTLSIYGGNVTVTYYGIAYPGAAYGSGNIFAFGWQTVLANAVTVSVDNGGAAYAIANASDERMKEGVAPSTFDCLSTVLKFPLKQFRWKTHDDLWKLAEAKAAEDAPVIPVGVIAQEIHKIFPDGVQKGDDHADHLGAVWGLNQNAMISLLIGAVQQLSARVQELEAR
jgi:Chaperone of endosialidase